MVIDLIYFENDNDIIKLYIPFLKQPLLLRRLIKLGTKSGSIWNHQDHGVATYVITKVERFN